MNYYNEIDPFCAQWLRNLISAGHIAPGDVDERSIEDVRPDDVRSYTQCHFFAGIGVWSYALRLAGWPDDRPVWTGSCPCQPFSQAGKGAGFADERHLWPAWHHLIRECRPATIFGEQVASPSGLGWYDLVQDDMEDAGYACAPVDLCASGLGAFVRRSRVYFVADADGEGRHRLEEPHEPAQTELEASRRNHVDRCSPDVSLAERIVIGRCGTRRVLEQGIEPLVDGDSESMEQRRAYGNAINPQVAAAFIRVYIESRLT